MPPIGDDPILAFDVISSGFQSARGNLEIFEANNYIKFTEDSEEESSRIANTIVTDEEIERVTAGLTDPKFKAGAVVLPAS